jgi:DNA-directed RNA polymerase subunit M/transcription elongation factor TFIIS
MENYRVLATDCPKCGAENVAHLSLEIHKKGLELNPPSNITCRECGHEYRTTWLELRNKTADEMNEIGGPGGYSYA